MKPHTKPARATLLLVDDNPDSLARLRGALQNSGYRSHVARSHQAATAAVNNRPDLILLDMMLPQMHGLAVYGDLLANPNTADIPVILLADATAIDGITQDLQMDTVDYISKPYRAEALLARITTQLSLTEASNTLAEPEQSMVHRHRDILDSIDEGIYDLDPDGVITFANPAASHLTGFASKELIGTSIYDIHLYARSDGRPYYPVENGIYVTLRDGQPSSSEEDVFWRADGDYLPVSWRCTALRSNGNIQGAVLLFSDISTRQRQAHALSEALAQANRHRERLQQENRYLHQALADQRGLAGIIGDSPAFRRVLDQLRQVAPTDSAVLIQGESGTGKETLAHAIHQQSARHNRPLIKVDCAAIGAQSIEGALFGETRHALANTRRRRPGYLELADGGTLLLDEIGALPVATQVKLLRVLQGQPFSPLGAGFSLHSDVRVIATSERDLGNCVAQGTFHADLLQHLSLCPLSAPPLRERREDIPLLAEQCLRDLARQFKRPQQRLSSLSLRQLQAHSWPGNLHELRNLIERGLLLTQAPEICIATLLPDATAEPTPGSTPGPTAVTRNTPLLGSLADNESAHILRVLEHTHWLIAGKGGAAEVLGLPASTLRSRMKKLGIQRPALPSTVAKQPQRRQPG